MKERQINRTAILCVLMSGTFLVSMTVTITNTMLPAIMNDYGVTTSTAQWLTSGATLMSGIMIPFAAFLMKMIPSKKYFMVAMSVFVFGAILACIAPSFPLLLLGRLIQAAGCGILMPFSQVVLMAIYPRERYGSVMSLYSLGSMAAPIIAPTIAGVFIDYIGWKAIFLMLGIIGCLVLAGSAVFMRNVTTLSRTELPLKAVLLSALGFSGILIGLGNLSGSSLLKKETGGMLLAGAAALAWFVYLQLHEKKVLLNLRVFRETKFRNAVILSILMYLICMGSGTLLPIYTQSILNYSASLYAFVTLPGSLVMAASTLIAGRIYDKMGAGRVMIGGLLVLLTGSVFGVCFRGDSGLFQIGLVSAFLSAGSGLLNSCLTTVSLSQLEGSDRIDGSAILNTLRQISSSLASIFAVTVNTGIVSQFGNEISGVKGVYACYLIFGILFGVIAVPFLRKAPIVK